MLGLVALGFASCDDKLPDAPIQTNPQEPILAAANIQTAVAGPLMTPTQVLNLNSYATTADVPFAAVTAASDIPAGGVVSYNLEIAGESDFSDAQVLPGVDMGNGVYGVLASDWAAAHQYIFGRNPKGQATYYRIPAYVELGGTKYRVKSSDYYVAQGTIEVKGADPGFVVYENYYFMSSATTMNLTEAAAYPMTHGKGDIYDNPTFEYTVEVSEEMVAAGFTWMVAAQPAVESGNANYTYGPEYAEDDNLAGLLVTDGMAQVGAITEAGKYHLIINLETLEYEFEPVVRPEYVAVPNQANNWSENGSWLTYFESRNCFLGAAVVDPIYGYKFLMDGTWCGAGDAEGEYNYGGGGNIGEGAGMNAGLYWFTVDTDAKTYTCTEITSLGLIGGFNGWGAQENLTPNAAGSVWEGDVNLSGEWKIRMNDDWGMNYGGSADELVFDASNISGFEGLYHVTIDFTGHQPVLTLTAK